MRSVQREAPRGVRMWRSLDGAALAASRLGRTDAAKKLEAAWAGAPSLARRVRWLVADGANAATIRKRAAATADVSPTRSKRLHAFLHVIVGDIPSAANVLKSAPGLGWSSDDHPGHLMFPVFAWLLADGTPKGVSGGVVEVLKQAPRSLLESHLEADEASTKLRRRRCSTISRPSPRRGSCSGPSRSSTRISSSPRPGSSSSWRVACS